MKASTALGLASQELLLVLFLCSCSEKWAKLIKEEVHTGFMQECSWGIVQGSLILHISSLKEITPYTV